MDSTGLRTGDTDGRSDNTSDNTVLPGSASPATGRRGRGEHRAIGDAVVGQVRRAPADGRTYRSSEGASDRHWSGRGLLGRLNREWEMLQRDPGSVATVRGWGRSCLALAGAVTPEDVLARVPGDPDGVLGFLLDDFSGGRALAGRVVLQAMLPKAVRTAARDRSVTVDDYVTALWCEIAAYPLARRPRAIAANLALDTLKAVRRENGFRVDVVTPPDEVALAADLRPSRVVGRHQPGSTDPDVRAVIACARQHRLVDARTGALLTSVYADGLPGRRAAERHDLTPVAVRIRCSRALKVLAGHASLLAEAA